MSCLHNCSLTTNAERCFHFPPFLMKVKILIRFVLISKNRYSCRSFVKAKWCNTTSEKQRTPVKVLLCFVALPIQIFSQKVNSNVSSPTLNCDLILGLLVSDYISVCQPAFRRISKCPITCGIFEVFCISECWLLLFLG